MNNPTPPEYCPKGKILRKKWTDHVRKNADVFYSRALCGFKNHVRKCPQCFATYQARHGIPNTIVAPYIKRAPPQTKLHRGDNSYIVIGGKVPRAKPCE